MCGLVLVVNKNRNGFNNQQHNVFSTLLYLSGGFRGRDGAGVVSVNNIGNVQLAKAALPVDTFLATKEYDKLQTDSFRNGWALMGHNRSATRGSITDENSHPFVVDDKIVLMHNGTFNGDAHKAIKDTEVDSEAIAHALAENDNVEEALRRVNAAYALIWYNVEKKQLHVIRNMQRPLWYMETHDSHIYASEEVFLQFVKKKFNLTLKQKPFEMKEGALTTFKLEEDRGTEVTCEDVDVSFYKHQNLKTEAAAGNRPPFHAKNEGAFAGSKPHPYACAWHGGLDDDDNDGFEQTLARPSGVVHYVPPKLTPRPVIIDTRNPDVKARILGAMKDKPLMTQGEWMNLAEAFKGRGKIAVLTNDLVEADDDPRTGNFVLMGKTCDKHQLDVCFPVTRQDLNKVISMASDAMFEVEYSGITWNRAQNVEQPGNDISKWVGVSLLHGVNPVAIEKATDAVNS